MTFCRTVLNFFPTTVIQKISIPYTSARISMSVWRVRYESTYKERRGCCFSLNTNVIQYIMDHFHSFLKAMKTLLRTTLGPQLLAQVTSFRVSVCANGWAAIFQTQSTKLHAQEGLSNQKCDGFSGTLEVGRCLCLSWSWVCVWRWNSLKIVEERLLCSCKLRWLAGTWETITLPEAERKKWHRKKSWSEQLGSQRSSDPVKTNAAYAQLCLHWVYQGRDVLAALQVFKGSTWSEYIAMQTWAVRNKSTQPSFFGLYISSPRKGNYFSIISGARQLYVPVVSRDVLGEPATWNFCKLTGKDNRCNKLILLDLSCNEFCRSILSPWMAACSLCP